MVFLDRFQFNICPSANATTSKRPKSLYVKGTRIDVDPQDFQPREPVQLAVFFVLNIKISLFCPNFKLFLSLGPTCFTLRVFTNDAYI